MRGIQQDRPPLPHFTRETAAQKVRMAEDAWNTRDPEKVSLAYTVDSTWRNRSEFFSGREAIVQLLRRKWAKELDYRLIKELWAFDGARALRCVLPTSGTMTRGIGSALTATRTGSPTSTGSCAGVSRVSTTCRFESRIANAAGR
jgi:hypothetical protein